MSKNVTLVLSGGGARGIAHIGVIQEIESRGYTISSIAGTSMGALVGGVYATGKMNEFLQWVHTLDRRDIFRLIDFSFSGQGLVKGDKVIHALKEIIPDTNIEDLKIKYTATAFDLAKDKEVVFNNGSLFEAIRASISIPTVFTPVISGDSVLVDGGIVNNIPISNAIRTKNDLLIAVYVNADIPLDKPETPEEDNVIRHNSYTKKIIGFKNKLAENNTRDHTKKFNYFNLINNTIISLMNNLAMATLKTNPPDILIEISRKSCGTYDFYKIEELIEIGKYIAKKKLDSI